MVLTRIISLRLHNIKSYTDARFDFTEGVNGIFGDNGHGKTTVLQAIGYALYGHLDGTKEDFVRKGEKSGFMELEVEGADGALYQIIRGVPGAKYEFITPTQKKITGKEQVTKEIDHNIFSSALDNESLNEVFKNIIGVPQGTFAAAFHLTPAARKKVFDPLLKVEEHKRAAEAIRPARATLKDKHIELDKSVSGNLQLIEMLKEETARLPKLKADKGEAEKETKELAEKLEKLNEQLKDSEEAKAAIDEKEKAMGAEMATLRQLEQQQSSVQEDAERFEKLTKRIAELEPRQKEYEELTKQLEKLRNEKDELARRLQKAAAAGAELKGLDQQLEEIAVTIKDAKEAKKELDGLKDKEARISTLGTELEGVRRQLQELLSLKTRDAELSDRSKELEGKLQPLKEVMEGEGPSKLAGRVDEISDSITKARGTQESYRTQMAQIGENKAKLTDGVCPLFDEECPKAKEAPDIFNARAAKLRDDMKANKKLIADLEVELEKARGAKEQLGKLNEAKTRAKELEDELAKLKEQREGMAIKIAQVPKLEAQQTHLKSEEKELKPLIQKLTLLQDKAGKLSELGIKMEKMEARKKELAEATTGLDEAQQAKDKLEDELTQAQSREKDLHTDHTLYMESKSKAEALKEAPNALEKLRASLMASKEKVSTLRKELDKLTAEFDVKAFDAMKDEQNKLNAKVGEMKASVKALEDQVAQLEAKVKKVDKLSADVSSDQKLMVRTERQMEMMDFVQRVLKNSAGDVAAALVQAISASASAIFCEIMEDYNLLLNWTPDYDLQLVEAGTPRSFEQLSGGEQMAASLSLRLAMLRELTGSDVVFLDEPTQNLDATRRANLSAQIKRVRGFRQIFVISHDDTFAADYQNIIHVTKTAGQSRVGTLEGVDLDAY